MYNLTLVPQVTLNELIKLTLYHTFHPFTDPEKEAI